MCLVETQANIYERFLSGMMEKDKKQEEKTEQPDEDEDDNSGESFHVLSGLHILLRISSAPLHKATTWLQLSHMY